MVMRRFLGSVLFLFAAFLIPACNSGGTATFTVGGSVTGLTGGTLTLQINGGESTQITADGSFSFPTPIAQGSVYTITVVSAPSGFAATVTNGTGTVTAAVTNVTVAVAVTTYTIGGTLTGLDGTIVLSNGIEQITLTADGAFSFPTPVANGTPFSISIVSAPGTQHCTVESLENGTVNGADITGVGVVCLDQFIVGGVVSGVNGSVVLHNNGGDEITITTDGAFTFPTPVIDGRGFEITVAGGSTTQRREITNGVGLVDGGDVNAVVVDCSDKAWIDPLLLADNKSPDGADANWPRVGIAANGDTVMVWTQSDGANSQVFMAECRSGTWTVPTTLTDNISPDGTDAWQPRVAVAPDGDSIIAWRQSDGADDRVLFSQYRNGVWTHPASVADAIDVGGSSAEEVRVAMGTGDEAIVLWVQTGNANDELFLSEFRYGTWTHPTSLGDSVSAPGSDVQSAEVAVGASGDVLVAVLQEDGGGTPRLFLSTRTNGAWTHPANLGEYVSPNFSAAAEPSLAVTDNGDAIMAWTQSDGANTRVFMSHRIGGVWIHPTVIGDAISPAGTDSFVPRVANSVSGNAIVTWTQDDGSDLQIFRSLYESGVWTHPTGPTDNISPDGWPAVGSSVAMSAGGDVVLSWQQLNATSLNIARAECRDSVWTLPADENDVIGLPGTSVILIDVSVSPWGDAVIVWQQSDGTDEQIFTSEFR